MVPNSLIYRPTNFVVFILGAIICITDNSITLTKWSYFNIMFDYVKSLKADHDHTYGPNYS